MIRTYECRPYPNKKIIQILNYQLDLCRQLYNCALKQRQLTYKMSGVSISYNRQATELPDIKKDSKLIAYSNIYSQVLQNALNRVDLAFDNFFDNLKSNSRTKAGYPHYNSYGQYRSLTYTQS